MNNDPNNENWHMTWQQQAGSLMLCLLLTMLIAMAIWLVVKDVNRDSENAAETNMIRVQLWMLTKSLYCTHRESTDHSDADMQRARRDRK